MKRRTFFNTLLLFTVTLFFSNNLLSQTTNSSNSISKLTEIMLVKKYSTSEIEEMKNSYPQKIKVIDYIYSKSFEIPEHQKYSSEQFEKIDITKYDLTRKLDEYVLVFDEASGLQIVLFSLNKMEVDKANINGSYSDKNNPNSKIAN